MIPFYITVITCLLAVIAVACVAGATYLQDILMELQSFNRRRGGRP